MNETTGIDGLDDIERWWITTGVDGRGFLAYDDPDTAHNALGKHEESERVVEVVPAEQLRGAVGTVDRLRDLLARIQASLEDGTLEIPDVILAVEQEIREALDAGA